LQFLQHFKDEADRPFSGATIQSQSDSRCFEDFSTGSAKVSSTADMEFNSAITLLCDADAQSNKLLVFPRQSTIFQRICFKVFKFPKSADSATKHSLIVFLADFPYLRDFIEHGFLLELGFGLNSR
jgi:hypothetical protein